MAVGDAYVFPGFLTPVLTQLFSPKPPTTFLTCLCRGERQKYAVKKVGLNRGDRTHNHQDMSPTRSPLSHPSGAIKNDILSGYKVFKPFPKFFRLYRNGLCIYPCFPGNIVFISLPHNILSKPKAAFPHNHCRHNEQRSNLFFKALLVSRLCSKITTKYTEKNVDLLNAVFAAFGTVSVLSQRQFTYSRYEVSCPRILPRKAK